MDDATRGPVLRTVGAWVAGLRTGDLPATTRQAARYQVLDMLAAAYGATASTAARRLADGIAATAGEGGRATVFPSGNRLPPVEAAMGNAVHAMAHDFDDIVWTGHTGHSAVFASLAVAEHEEASSAETLAAVVCANEVAGRLAASCYLGPINGQMVSYIHLAGAAAATARLLGLDAERTTHALAIALAQPPFALQPGFFGPDSKLLTAATPLATGIRAAYAARAGATGAPAILEAPRGFWDRFAFRPLPEMMEGLGTFWTTETLHVKTFPGCFYFQTACTALQEILDRHPDLRLGDVQAVRIDTTKLGTEVTRFAAEYAGGTTITPVDVDFDLSVVAAILLHARRFTPREHDAAWLAEHTPALQAWRQRITVRHDPELTLRVLQGGSALPAGRRALRGLGPLGIAQVVRRYRAEYRSSLLGPREALGWARAALGPRGDGAEAPPSPSPSAIPLYFPARVSVELSDGRVDTVRHDLPAGAFCAPGVEAQVRAKFCREAGIVLGPDRAEAAFEALLHLEEHPLAALVQQLSPQTV